MNIVTATARLLRQDTNVSGLVNRVDKWRLRNDVNGTGEVVAVVSLFGSWHEDPMGTARFPRIYLYVHADVSRNSSDQKTVQDAEDRAMAVWEAANALLQVPSREVRYWGGAAGTGIRILGSDLASEPQYITRPGALEVAMLRATYNVKVG